MNPLVVGIYGSSTQSGMAFTADLIDQRRVVYGYARPSDHGKEFVDAVTEQRGIYVQRPEGVSGESSKFVDINGLNDVGHDLERLVNTSDVIILSHPAIYQEESARLLRDAGILEKRTPLVLAPGRSFPGPYMWQELGENYPLVVFSTCPYSCKVPSPGTSFIKRRKRTLVASLEGNFDQESLARIMGLFPQVIYTDIPATTSLGNIGAIFHPTPYILAWDEIKANEGSERQISFYIELITQRPEVGVILEKIDQMRIGIAAAIGIPVFGYASHPREEEWRHIMWELRRIEENYVGNIEGIRALRAKYLQPIGESVISAQQWLDITYGVERIPGESLSGAIARTPTYQKKSVPQKRYVEEDVPASLVPLEAAAIKFGVSHDVATEVISSYGEKIGRNPRLECRNLNGFDTSYLKRYLTGEL